MDTLESPVSSEIRQVIGDVTWSAWRALVGRPQFAALTPEVFLRMRRAVEDVVIHQWRLGGWARIFEADAWASDLTDRVAPLLEQVTGGGMARGPLAILVTDALRAGLTPTVTGWQHAAPHASAA